MTLQNRRQIKWIVALGLAASFSIFAQQEEFMFEPLVVDPDSTMEDSTSNSDDELIFDSLISRDVSEVKLSPLVTSDDRESSNQSQPDLTPLQKAADQPAPQEPQKKQRLRDPFWPIGYIPDSWKEKEEVVVDADVENKLWQEAFKKIRVSFVKVVQGTRVAFINGKPKRAGDTVEVPHAGKTFQWALLDVYENGRLRLKKLGTK